MINNASLAMSGGKKQSKKKEGAEKARKTEEERG